MDLTHTTVEHVPQGCFLCGSHNPPYLDTQLVDATIQTADGPKTVLGRVAICVGSDERPGCAVQIGRTARLIDRAEHDAAWRHIHKRDEELSAALTKIKELEASQVKVVPLDELEARLQEA